MAIPRCTKKCKKCGKTLLCENDKYCARCKDMRWQPIFVPIRIVLTPFMALYRLYRWTWHYDD